MHKIRTFNQISQVGLDRFSESEFMISPHQTEASAYLLRSHKLEIDDLHEPRLRAIARAGAGTNNVPVQDCTEKGIVVFNTPGANANAVKELVLCGMLLASRGVVPGINFASAQQNSEEYSVLAKLMETEKKRMSPMITLTTSIHSMTGTFMRWSGTQNSFPGALMAMK